MVNCFKMRSVVRTRYMAKLKCIRLFGMKSKKKHEIYEQQKKMLAEMECEILIVVVHMIAIFLSAICACLFIFKYIYLYQSTVQHK